MADQPSAPGRKTPRSWSQPLILASGLLLTILVVGLTVWHMQPPPSLPADAPAGYHLTPNACSNCARRWRRPSMKAMRP
jgi:hypothetical protein